MFKQMEDKHKKTVDQLKGRVKSLEKDNVDLTEQLRDAQAAGTALLDPDLSSFRDQLQAIDDATFRHITDRVFRLIKADPGYVTRADLSAGLSGDVDQALARLGSAILREICLMLQARFRHWLIEWRGWNNPSPPPQWRWAVMYSQTRPR
jgi:hypothetical protein